MHRRERLRDDRHRLGHGCGSNIGSQEGGLVEAIQKYECGADMEVASPLIDYLNL